MRITAATIYRDSTASIERTAQRLQEFQRQVASGKRIDRPSDDPQGTAASIGERAEIAAIEQYTRTSDSVTARLTVMDTALTDIIDRLTQAQSTVVSAQGSSKAPVQLEAAAKTLEGVKEAIAADLNVSFRGTHLFAGANSATPPWVVGPGGTVSAYQGATLEVDVDIDDTRAVTVGIDGSTISQGAAAADIFSILDAAIAAARTGDDDGLTQARRDLDVAFERATGAQMRIGTGLATIEAQQTHFSDRRLASLARVAKIEDANMAEAITGMNQADASYRAALAATGKITQLSLMDYLS